MESKSGTRDPASNASVPTLENCMRANGDALLAYVNRQIPSDLRRVADPQDVVQDVFFESLRRVNEFSTVDPGFAKAWLFTVARHRVVGLLRSHRAGKRGGGRTVGEADIPEHLEVISLLQELSVYERTPSQSAMAHEMLRALEGAIEAIAADQRMALRLRYMQSLTVPETASVMQKTEPAVRMLCVRGLQSLRALLRSASFT